MINNIHENKWSQLEKRLNLQSIGEFIRHGGDVTQIDTRSFTERLECADKDLHTYLENTCGKDKTYGILEMVAVYANIRADVYFALGMKAGAQITLQLTGNFESDCLI
jgi:hypothetical protein